jgi:hypothetical protein
VKLGRGGLFAMPRRPAPAAESTTAFCAAVAACPGPNLHKSRQALTYRSPTPANSTVVVMMVPTEVFAFTRL